MESGWSGESGLEGLEGLENPEESREPRESGNYTEAIESRELSGSRQRV